MKRHIVKAIEIGNDWIRGYTPQVERVGDGDGAVEIVFTKRDNGIVVLHVGAESRFQGQFHVSFWVGHVIVCPADARQFHQPAGGGIAQHIVHRPFDVCVEVFMDIGRIAFVQSCPG